MNKEPLVVTPNLVAAIALVCPWLGDWRPLESMDISGADAEVKFRGIPVHFRAASPPIPIPSTIHKIPSLAVNLGLFDKSQRFELSQITHLWGGPTGRRGWHEALDINGVSVDLNWYSVLSSLTLVDQGLMVRREYVGYRVTYFLFHWGPSIGLTEATIAVREQLLEPA